MSKSNNALSLGEALFALAIIGVIAALTLPNLNESTGNKEKVAKVKKIYQNINDALGRAEATYGPYKEWTITDATDEAKAKRIGDRVTEFMKVSKNCGTSTTGCFVTDIKPRNVNDRYNVSSTSYYKFITADGTSIAIGPGKNPFGASTCFSFYTDIDGLSKGANLASKDIFQFNIDPDSGEITPMGGSYDTISLLTSGCFDQGGLECTSWVVNNDNMDYLKTDSNGKCSNGTVLSKTTISCN